MSSPGPVLHVARWEFMRYVKPKQQVVGFVITLAMLLALGWITRRADQRSAVEISVVAAANLPTLGDSVGRFRFAPAAREQLPSLLAALDSDDGDPVLVLGTDGSGTLHARHEPRWLEELRRELSIAIQLHRFQRSGLTAAEIARISTPFQLGVQESAPRAGRAERLAALIAMGLVLIGLFSGIGYVFGSVTGEKQNRLSEQIISTIPAQAWIDGKILGLAAVSVVAVLNFIIAGIVYLPISRLLWDATLFVPPAVTHPALLLTALLFVALGFLFWFSFLVATAAIIDDPHSSNRTQILFIPMLGFLPAFLAIPDIDATWVRVLGILPPTSAGVLPVRLLTTDVPAWETTLALLLLAAAIWLVRRSAGRVFRLGMLMYGKEPTWSELRRWLREP